MSAIAGTYRGPYATYTWMKVSQLLLVFVISLLSCLAVYIAQYDFDYNEPDEEIVVNETNVAEVTVTATPDYR